MGSYAVIQGLLHVASHGGRPGQEGPVSVLHVASHGGRPGQEGLVSALLRGAWEGYICVSHSVTQHTVRSVWWRKGPWRQPGPRLWARPPPSPEVARLLGFVLPFPHSHPFFPANQREAWASPAGRPAIRLCISQQ